MLFFGTIKALVLKRLFIIAIHKAIVNTIFHLSGPFWVKTALSAQQPDAVVICIRLSYVILVVA